MLKHTRELQCKRDLCDYSSDKSNSLKMQMLKHTKEQRYKCDLRDYSWNHSNYFKKHVDETMEKNDENVAYVIIVVLS